MIARTWARVVMGLFVLALGGPASATGYTSAANGNWGADATWFEPGWPDDNTDTAAIQAGHNVQSKDAGGAGLNIPSLAAGGIALNGQLTLTASQSNANTVASNGGTVASSNALTHTGNWALSFTNGGLHFTANSNSHSTFANGTCVINPGTTIFTVHSGGGGRGVYNGAIAGVGTISVNKSLNGGPMDLGGNNAGFTGQYQVNSGAGLRLIGANSLGSPSKITLDGGYVATFMSGGFTLSTPLDIDTAGGYVTHNERNVGNALTTTSTITALGAGARALTFSAGDDGRATYHYVDSLVSGPFNVNLRGYWRGAARLYLRNSANTFNLLDVQLNQTSNYNNGTNRLYVTDVGAMGGAPITVRNNSTNSAGLNGRFVLQDAGGAGDWDHPNTLTLEDSTYDLMVQYDGLDNLTVTELTLGGTVVDNGVWIIGTDTPNGITLTDWFDVDDVGLDTITVGAARPVPEPAGLALLGLGLLGLRRTKRRERRCGMGKRSWMVVWAALTMLALAGPALAVSPYNDAADGDWDAAAVDTWGQGIGVYPNLAGDQATVNSNIVTGNITMPMTTAGGGYVEVDTNGMLRLPLTVTQNAPITLDGGSLRLLGPGGGGDPAKTRFSPISVTSNSIIDAYEGNTTRGELSGDISGTGDLIPYVWRDQWTLHVGRPAGYSGVGDPGNDNSGFSGDWVWDDTGAWDIKVGIRHDGGGLGSGDVYLNKALLSNYAMAGGDLGNDIIVRSDGGALWAQRRDSSTTTNPSYSGTITLNGELQLTAGDDGRTTTLTISGPITGPHKVWTPGDYTSPYYPQRRGGMRLYITNPANSYAELDVDVVQASSYSTPNLVYVTDVGAMGGAAVTVRNTSTDAAGAAGRFVLQDAGGAGDWYHPNSLTIIDETYDAKVQYDGLDNLTVTALTIGGTVVDNGVWIIGTDSPNGITLTDWFDVDDVGLDTITVGAARPVPEPSGLGLAGLALLAVRKKRN